MFDNDAHEAAHSLHIDLRKLSKLMNIFDFTSYTKGNCMVHMIYHFLGERIFFSSVRYYMRTYGYRNADQEDLWSAFQAEIDGAKGLLAFSELHMKDIMRTWTYQAGLPVLHVQQNRKTGAIELTQVRRCLSQIDLAFLHLVSTTTNYLSMECIYDDINHRYSLDATRKKDVAWFNFANKLYGMPQFFFGSSD